MAQLLSVEPQELTFHLLPRRRASSRFRLRNDTQLPVAFKILANNPEKYTVQMKVGIVFAGSTCDIKVRTQGPMESISEIECKDKFSIMNVVAGDGTTWENVSSLFREPVRDAGKNIKLRVKYVFPRSQPGSSNYSRPRADPPVYDWSQWRPPYYQEVQPRQDHMDSLMLIYSTKLPR